jgi:hypothetical protein
MSLEQPRASGNQEFLDEYFDESGDRRVGISEAFSDDGRYEDGLPSTWFSFRKLWLFMGPGFLMSIAYLVRCTVFTNLFSLLRLVILYL